MNRKLIPTTTAASAAHIPTTTILSAKRIRLGTRSGRSRSHQPALCPELRGCGLLVSWQPWLPLLTHYQPSAGCQQYLQGAGSRRRARHILPRGYPELALLLVEESWPDPCTFAKYPDGTSILTAGIQVSRELSLPALGFAPAS
eukprot:scaffold907_cov398-Prasinococcus_capsulatus_cf.AAC.11